MILNMLWNEGKESDWKEALVKYYSNPYDRYLERRMEELLPSDLEMMNVNEFYSFLYDEYFVWKYTAKNRLATTRNSLLKYESEGLAALEHIQHSIIQAYNEDPNDTGTLLEITRRIHGLGIAGASGLLSVFYPEYYGALSQFLVYSLLEVDGLKEHDLLLQINPQILTMKDGILLESILRSKATDLNLQFNTTEWTPRKIDMILWAIDRY